MWTENTWVLRVSKGLRIPVKVHEVKESYGRVLALVIPRDGNGSEWVDTSRLS